MKQGAIENGDPNQKGNLFHVGAGSLNDYPRYLYTHKHPRTAQVTSVGPSMISIGFGIFGIVFVFSMTDCA